MAVAGAQERERGFLSQVKVIQRFLWRYNLQQWCEHGGGYDAKDEDASVGEEDTSFQVSVCFDIDIYSLITF